MAFSRVLWLGARKRFWHHSRILCLAVAAAPAAWWILAEASAALAMPTWFLLFAALIYHSYVLAVIVGMVWNLRPESRRKLAHLIGGFGLLAAAPVGSTGLVIALCLLLLGWTVATRSLPALKMYRQLSVDRRDGSSSWGDVLFPLGVASAAVVVGVDSPQWLAATGVLVLADSAAAVVGTRWGRHHFRFIGGRKSVEGSLAFLLCASACLLFLVVVGGATWPILACAGVAVVACVVEAGCGKGWDNLILPWGVLLGLQLPLEWTGTQTLVLTLALGLLVSVVAIVQRRMPTGEASRT